MAVILKDRVKETTTTSGTGSVTLAGPVQGYQGFSSLGEGSTTYYCIAGIAEWEVGIGIYSGGVLSRDTVLDSSSNGAKVGFSSGVKDVFCTLPSAAALIPDRLSVIPGVFTDPPNNTVNVAVLTASVQTANGDLALSPKGTGAFLANYPTGSVTGGNKRGANAVDLQTLRYNATEVASGLYSVITGGDGNTASGAWATISGGSGNTASNSFATVAGGAANQATSTSAAVSGGSGNIASGAASTISGGSTHRANSNYSYISGGAYGTTRGIVGYHAFPACNAPVTDDTGKSQKGLLILGIITTSATTQRLRSDTAVASATNQLTLPNNSAYYIQGSVIASRTGAAGSKSWRFEVQMKRGANAASTVVGALVSNPFEDAGTSTWAIALSADTTNGGLAIDVTGQASTTIRWVCRLETTEVSF